MKTYITFGQDHRHVINGVIYDRDCVAVIESENEKTGREKAFELFGNKFCFEYPERYFKTDNMMHFPRGLIKV